MPAYVFAIVKNITNIDQYTDYTQKNIDIVNKYGGKFLYRNNNREHIEGQSINDRIVIVEFPNNQQAKNWYNSQEYQEIKKIRDSISDASIYVLDSYPA